MSPATPAAPPQVDLDSLAYRAYHDQMVAAIRASLFRRWPPQTQSAVAHLERQVLFFDRECTYDEEFFDGVDPQENADDQIDAAL